jgi:hypothetical protein
MIYSSLVVLAMSASAVVNPFTNLVHLHPKAVQPDTRVSVVLMNKSMFFQDVKIGDKVYTVQASHTLSVKAPVGTVVYAASASPTHHRGDAIVEVTPALNNQIVKLQ